MPKNTDYLSELAKYNEEHGVTATFSEMKKTARRIEKLHETMPESWRLTGEDYFRLVSDRRRSDRQRHERTRRN